MPKWEVPYTNTKRSEDGPEDETIVDVGQSNGEVVPIVGAIESGGLDDCLIASVQLVNISPLLSGDIMTYSFSLTASFSNFESLFIVSKYSETLKLLRTLPHLGSR